MSEEPETPPGPTTPEPGTNGGGRQCKPFAALYRETKDGEDVKMYLIDADNTKDAKTRIQGGTSYPDGFWRVIQLCTDEMEKKTVSTTVLG